MATDLTVRYCSLFMLPRLVWKRQATEEEGEAWQAGSWLLDSLSEEACKQSFPPSSVWSHYMQDQVSAVPDFCTQPQLQPSRGLSAFSSLPDDLTTLHETQDSPPERVFVVVVFYRRKKIHIHTLFFFLWVCQVFVVVIALLLFLHRTQITQGQLFPEAKKKKKSTVVLFSCYFTF